MLISQFQPIIHCHRTPRRQITSQFLIMWPSKMKPILTRMKPIMKRIQLPILQFFKCSIYRVSNVCLTGRQPFQFIVTLLKNWKLNSFKLYMCNWHARLHVSLHVVFPSLPSSSSTADGHIFLQTKICIYDIVVSFGSESVLDPSWFGYPSNRTPLERLMKWPSCVIRLFSRLPKDIIYYYFFFIYLSYIYIYFYLCFSFSVRVCDCVRAPQSWTF